ncbi:hypothetical protein C2G38_2175998 [Gigaspora rosea]|uniref:DUF3504 domain-containing protein n=1 Tax=Gigaspora rosea TaxID=44941 RepID=A0A397VIH3_9GLOM|nr:hypothetical protein C2G38_2175998 [Gigaspora rosea]
MPKANKSTLLNESDDHGNIETISDPKELESNLIHFFSYAKRSDKEEYSVNSVLSAIAAFQRYITENSPLKGINISDKQQFPTLNTLLNGKFKWLSAKGKGETKGSKSLTVDECLHILKHNCTSPDTPWGLFNRVFFFNALFFALRGGEHYFLEKDHFQKRQDGGYDIVIYKSKSNQPIDGNPEDILDEQIWYKDKHVGEKRLGTYLRYIVIASGIDISNRKITNRSGRKTTIQLLKSFGASDYECMPISRHKSQTGFQQYERPKNNIQINKLGDLSRMIMPNANYDDSQDQINPLLTKKAILTNATTQVANMIPTFQTAKKILQDSQFNNIKNNESITLSTTSSHESFEEFNESSQGNIYNNNNSNVTYHIHHNHYYFTSPSQ